MKSSARGKATSASVESITPVGLWLFVSGEELFLPRDQFPMFEGATVAEIMTVEYSKPGHLRWPALDVDLEVDSIRHPEAYPLVSRRCRVAEAPGSPGRSRRRTSRA